LNARVRTPAELLLCTNSFGSTLHSFNLTDGSARRGDVEEQNGMFFIENDYIDNDLRFNTQSISFTANIFDNLYYLKGHLIEIEFSHFRNLI
jgi:hypothetical protein